MDGLNFFNMLGYTNNAYIFSCIFGNPSNVILTDNPEYTLRDFRGIFPIFNISCADDADQDQIPYFVFSFFLSMANACIKEERYKSNWKYFMSLFIAHHLTLYLKANSGDPGIENALKNSTPTIGVAQSKSVDGLSISYEIINAANDLARYGTWNLTLYGQQLVTLTRPYGHGGMWVNW